MGSTMTEFKPSSVIAETVEKSVDEHINWLVASVKLVGEKRAVSLTESGNSVRSSLSEIRNNDCDEDAVTKVVNAWIRFVHDVMVTGVAPMVESDFVDTEASTIEKFLEIYGTTLKVFVDEKLQSLVEKLGNDYADLLLWARGELCYMFTTCKIKQKEKLDEAELRIAKFGIGELGLMFRKQKDIDEDFDAQGDGGKEALGLIKLGILSNSHLLATMYAGEMCYWAWTQEGRPALSVEAKFKCSDAQCETKLPANYCCSRCKNAHYCSRECQKRHWKAGGHKQSCGTASAVAEKEVEGQTLGSKDNTGDQAIRFLQKYVTAISGNFQLERAWNTDRAKELLAELTSG